MPSITHTGLLQPFEHRPSFAADLLVDTFGLTLPVWGQARLTSADLTQAMPTEYRADLAIALYQADRPVLAVVLEVQLRKDHDKLHTWPVYLTTLRARLRCPAVLLVVCPRRATAAWAANVIEIGAGSLVTPLVLGPTQTPVVTDPAQASEHPSWRCCPRWRTAGRTRSGTRSWRRSWPPCGRWSPSTGTAPRYTMTLSPRCSREPRVVTWRG